MEKIPLLSSDPSFLVGTNTRSQSQGLLVGKELSIFLPPFVLEGCPVSEDKPWKGSQLFISTQLHLPCIYGNSSQNLATGLCQSWLSALWAFSSCCLLRYISGKLGKYVSGAFILVPFKSTTLKLFFLQLHLLFHSFNQQTFLENLKCAGYYTMHWE